MSLVHELKKISQGISILYVEDENSLRENMQIYLKKIYDDVRCVRDGALGLEEYRKKPADIVITDIFMPSLDGIDMLNEIVKINKEQKIIIITASTESQERINSICSSYITTIIKPSGFDEIIEVLYNTTKQV